MIRRAPALLALLTLAGAAWPAAAAAQDRRALSKSELVRLIVAETYDPAEIAAIVRRNCLTFAPSVGDRADLRALGATDEVMAALDDCVHRSEPVRISLERRSVTAAAGDTVALRVTASRSSGPASGVRLVLRERGEAAGTRSASTTADGEGRAVFRLPAGTAPGQYDLEADAPQATVRGSARMTLRVTAGAPARVGLAPDRLVLEPGEGRFRSVSVAVRDRFDNPVTGVSVALAPARPGGASPARAATTDDGGEVTLLVDAAAARRQADDGGGGILDVLVAGESRAVLPFEIAPADTAEGRVAAAEETPAALGDVAADGGVPDRGTPGGGERPAEGVGGDADGAEGEDSSGGLAARRPAALLETRVWGGGTFEVGRSAGNGAVDVLLQPVPSLRLRGLFDEGLNLWAPALVRGGDAFQTLLAGAALDWGAGGRLTTAAEAGRREQASELYQYLYRVEQTVRFDVPNGRAAWRAGGILGRWHDRDDWVAYVALDLPLAAASGLLAEVSAGETVGTNVGETGRRADRDARLSLGAWHEAGGIVRVEPVLTLGRVSSDDPTFDGTLVEGRIRVSVAVSPAARLQLFLRHQRPPGDPAFTSVAAGLSFRLDRRP